jgi:hypothetical protein
MLARVAYFLLFWLTATVAHGQELEFQLSNDMARVIYTSAAMGQNYGRLELEGGFLYADDDDRPSSDYLLHFGTQVRGESVDAPLIVAVGARLYYGEAGISDVGGLGIGGDVILMPESWKGLGIGAFLYVVPSIVSFQDADGMNEYGVTLNFQITSQALITLGYQNIEADIKDAGTYTIDDGAYLGLGLSF